MLHTEIPLVFGPDVYPPSEDTQLLLDTMRIETGERVLDMGTGSGILAVAAALEGGEVTAVDISPEALACARRNAGTNGVEIAFIESDLFRHVKGSFDVVIFNPPYLPTEEWSNSSKGDQQWDGGGDGVVTIERFLRDLPDHLAPEGKCYLLFSSLSGSGEESVRKLMEPVYDWREVGTKRLFFEILYVYECTLS